MSLFLYGLDDFRDFVILVSMNNAETVRQKLAEHSDRLRALHVSSLSLFGSAARGEATVHDLDFLVEFSEPPGLVSFMELKFFLEECFGLPVDLHTAKSCPERFYQRIENELQHVA